MHLGDYAATNEGSRESTTTLDVTGGGAAGGEDDDDGDSDSSLPTLQDLFSQAKAARTLREEAIGTSIHGWVCRGLGSDELSRDFKFFFWRDSDVRSFYPQTHSP